MISIIVCSIDEMKRQAVEAMYRSVIQQPLEFIGVRNPPSLAAGFNHGASQSHGETLIFSHDDIEIISPNLNAILNDSLKRFDLIGVAGTNRLIAPGWNIAGVPYVFGQIIHPSRAQGEFNLNIFGAARRWVGDIQALDGVFMAARRDLWESSPFDEATFDGFHFYDLDFSLRAHLAGRKLAVRNDIHILHGSIGNYSDPKWNTYAGRFVKKHAAQMKPNAVRKHQWAGIVVQSLDEARARMDPGYWDENWDEK